MSTTEEETVAEIIQEEVNEDVEEAPKEKLLSLEDLRREVEALQRLSFKPTEVEIRDSQYHAEKLEQMSNTTFSITEEDVKVSRPKPRPLEPRVWKINNQGRLVDFSLSEARADLIFRIKNSQFFTLEECKIFLREIVDIVRRDAERDLRNLMFLSKFRTEQLFPKPITQDYVGEKADLKGFKDDPDEEELIYGKRPPQTFISEGTQPKQKLHELVVETNKSLVKLIDTSLRQRKERILLSATIIQELEEIPEIARFITKYQFENYGKKMKQ